ncbi:glyoxalase [Azoarcus communis]|uniref:VOC family protein n=1 Tax=Parazoarcus communis TaxID=41977 RepID=UPI0014594C81|nr:VOC family protein [Parazoarcus communis]NMG49849.1 glyoxalase [Parazoarcus communis]
MAEISTLAYVVAKASNLDKWEHFATHILGLQTGARTAEALLLRMDEREQRLIIERGDEDDLSVLGWEFDNAADLKEYVARLREHGVDVTESAVGLAQARGMEQVYGCVDPAGIRHEFAYGPRLAPISRPFHSPLLVGGGFETGELGIGHVFAVARDAAESIHFYTEILGLRISDYIRDEEAIPGLKVDGCFMHAKTRRHHSLATAAVPSNKKINHLMIQVKSLDDVGLAFDRIKKAGVPVIMDIGHHPNDKMVSFYVVTPSGFGLEYGWGGIVIDENNWQVRTYSQLSDWGHRFSLPPQ